VCIVFIRTLFSYLGKRLGREKCLYQWGVRPRLGWSGLLVATLLKITGNFQILEPASEQPGGDVSVTLRLSDSDESRKLWDFTFQLDFKVPVPTSQVPVREAILRNGFKNVESYTYFAM